MYYYRNAKVTPVGGALGVGMICSCVIFNAWMYSFCLEIENPLKLGCLESLKVGIIVLFLSTIVSKIILHSIKKKSNELYEVIDVIIYILCSLSLLASICAPLIPMFKMFMLF